MLAQQTEPLNVHAPVVSLRQRLSAWRAQLLHLLLKRRVFISAMLFGGMVVEDVASGVAPHDILNFRDAAAMSGLLFVGLGLAIRTWSAGFLIKDEKLTTDGPYAIIRNPLYLGSFLMVLGFCLLIGDLKNLWICAVALPIIYYPKVLNEEQILARRYPADWIAYAAGTPRLIPRRLGWPSLDGWQMSQWLLSREYNAVVATGLAIVALKALRELRI